MTETPSKFACAACGKEYRWKPELAGRGARCKCGATVQVPATDPAAAPPAPPADDESSDDIYALAADAEQAASRGQTFSAPDGAYAVVAAADDDDEPAPSAPRRQEPRRAGPTVALTSGGFPIRQRPKIEPPSRASVVFHNVRRGVGYLLLGVLLAGYGLFEFVTLARLEETGGSHRMRIWIWVLYKIAGKWAILVTFGGMGLLVALAGLLALFGKLDTDGE